jgi:hypothetical protein
MLLAARIQISNKDVRLAGWLTWHVSHLPLLPHLLLLLLTRLQAALLPRQAAYEPSCGVQAAQ